MGSIGSLWELYNWQGSLLALVGIVAIIKLSKFLLFKIPTLARAREINRTEDKLKWKQPKYPPVVRASQKVGLATNVFFFLFVAPFCVTLESQPAWKILLDVFVILMFYDFFYYLVHRFWFHGNGKMRLVHAVHHQARTPTYLDAHYVHPLETFVGLALYVGSISFLAIWLGPYHVTSIVLTYVIYTQINIINHTRVDCPHFPYRTLTWITSKHHVHHQNMHKGNYASITLFFDKAFGTLD
jgi:sterol desaturase/sphingolipid hydroxylase (fatty acid hydroxylase superfamily)